MATLSASPLVGFPVASAAGLSARSRGRSLSASPLRRDAKRGSTVVMAKGGVTSSPPALPSAPIPPRASRAQTAATQPARPRPAYGDIAAGGAGAGLAVGVVLLAGASALAVKNMKEKQSAEMAALAGYNLPPGDLGAPGIGESLEYLQDMRAFVKKKTAEYGPVWKTHIFGKPTVMIGGVDAIREYRKEVEPLVQESSLPATFVELTTPYMSLNQKGERLEATRAVLKQLVGQKALEQYFPMIDATVAEYCGAVSQKQGGDFSLMGELRDVCLDISTQAFMGRKADDTMRKQFDDFNSGLLGLVPVNCPFTALGKGVSARDEVQSELLSFMASIPEGEMQAAPQYYALRTMRENVDETGARWTDERVSIAALLMVWGSYVEVATMIGDLMYLLPTHPDVLEKIRAEAKAALGTPEGLTKDVVDTKLPYIEACLRETTRFMPPTGPGMRASTQDVQVAGYDIPAGWVVCAEPRIGWCTDALYPGADRFNPDNFFGRRREPEDFFPGGIGSHQCPGVPMAEFVAKVFIARFAEKFDSWEPVSDAPPSFEAMPINIIKDEYRVRVPV